MRYLKVASLFLAVNLLGCVPNVKVGWLFVPPEGSRIGYSSTYTIDGVDEVFDIIEPSTTSGVFAQRETVPLSDKDEGTMVTITTTITTVGGSASHDCDVESSDSVGIIWDSVDEYFECTTYTDLLMEAEEYGIYLEEEDTEE